MAAASMMHKSNRKSTQQLHPLFARGIKEPLRLEVLADRLSASTLSSSKKRRKASDAGDSGASARVFELLFSRVAVIGCIQKKVYVVARRPGSNSQFNCHQFKVLKGASRAEVSCKPAPPPSVPRLLSTPLLLTSLCSAMRACQSLTRAPHSFWRLPITNLCASQLVEVANH
jgi:hypothetical protein